MKINDSIERLIGSTPLIELNGFKKENEILNSNILGKLEYLNPTGSIKDRIVLEILNDAEEKMLLKKGSTIIEPTSGNTGISLAAIASARGYKVIIVMPDSMSIERIKILKQYGAEVYLTEAKYGMKGSIKKAKEIASNTKHSLILGQFTNPNNPIAHYKTTAKEIWNDTNGKIDYLVCGIGTGGTISGVGKYLKEKNSDIKVIGVEPSSSPFLSKGISGSHKLQGLGAGFIPYTLNLEVIDEIITVDELSAYEETRIVAKADGITLGISSGAALYAAKTIAKRNEARGKNIVVILPDGGSKYLSTPLYND